MIDIRNCYVNGDLAGALAEAARFVSRIGEKNVRHIVAWQDYVSAWWVDVVYIIQPAS